MSIEKVSIVYDKRRTDGRPWLVRWYGEGTDSTRPKRYCKSFKLKKDAERFAAQKQHEFDQGEVRDRPNLTLQDLCRLFLESRQHLLRPSTLNLYRVTLDQAQGYFSPHRKIADISRSQAEKFITSRTVVHPDHRRSHTQLSAWGRNGHRARMQALFNFAQEHGYIRINPFAGIKPVKANGSTWHFVNPEEFKRLLAATPNLRTRCLYGMLYGCGLRFGEAVNLLWRGQNIDFQRNRVNIQNRMPTANLPGFLIKDKEIRSVPVPAWLVEMLKELKREENGDCPFVFLSPERWMVIQAKWTKLQQEGKPEAWFNRDVMNNALRNFKQHCKKAGIDNQEKLTLHCLRKSYCQNLANAGIPAITMLRLTGHSSLRVCEQYYLKVADANERQAMAAMDKLMEEGSEDGKGRAGTAPG